MIRKVYVIACLAWALILGTFYFSLFAEEKEGIQESTSLNFVFATTLETKAKIIETVIIPHNVQFEAAFELAPVSVNGTGEATWTPLPFLQVIAGGSVGSGWNIPIANGLRMNERIESPAVEYENAELTGGPFSGLVWSVKGGGVFQFDYAALKPGEWNHVVFRTYHGLQYRALTSADSEDSWLYEADSGQNRNGWNYYGNYFLGYQMPIFLDTVGILVESDLYLYDTNDRKLWGDDLVRWTFGPLFNFAVTKKISMALLIQMHTGVRYTSDTADYKFYQDRRVTDDDKNYIEFYRAALNMTVKLR